MECAKLEQLRAMMRKMKHYEEAIGVLHWDLRTGAPRQAAEGRAQVIATLSGELFQLQTSNEMEAVLQTLSKSSTPLSPMEQKCIEECRRIYDQSRKIPQAQFEAYVALTAQAESEWEEAKHANDWERFAPFLTKIVEMNRQFVELWGYKAHPYDALLDMYEPGLTVAEIDPIFEQLRDETVQLLQQVKTALQQPDVDLLARPVSAEVQMNVAKTLLAAIGYNFEAGRLDYSVHPFATGLNLGDVRITTNVREHDLSFCLFSSLHEGGHALYEQNVSATLADTVLCAGTSMGIHESQSRLWENQIGRSGAVWVYAWPILREAAPGVFDDVALDDFVRALNAVSPSLIRIEADELTYNLHVLIRYELEKALFEGTLEVKDLPAAWNAKYKAYLGVEPKTYAEGVLQDVHWAGGAFGYFPTYTLGNLYAAQFYATFRAQHPQFDDEVRSGQFSTLQTWLRDHIHQFGKSKSPGEIVQDVTGEPLNPSYFVQYMREKVWNVYGGAR
jgi:carboxypeptidase Taq